MEEELTLATEAFLESESLTVDTVRREVRGGREGGREGGVAHRGGGIM